MKLYYSNMSSSSRRVSLVVAHLGIELEHVHIDLMTDRARITALNPNSKIPVLEDGDFILWESNAIAEYLCERVPGQTLVPAEPRARADVQRWLFWQSAHLAVALGGLAYEKMWKKIVSGGDPDPARVAEHERNLGSLSKVLEAHLAGREWMVGRSLTLADFSIATAFMYAGKLELSLAAYPSLRAHLERVHALPAWKQTEPRW
ncbi:MAG TPA: glutathione S-transferase family protein [Kofleriaceae bacterium]|nr:glutathione S-transferase family protein [Kofleriaceae bacterium]